MAFPPVMSPSAFPAGSKSGRTAPEPWAGPFRPRGLHTLPEIQRFPETPRPATSPWSSPCCTRPLSWGSGNHSQGVGSPPTVGRWEAVSNQTLGADGSPGQTQDWGCWCPEVPLPCEDQHLCFCGRPSPLLWRMPSCPADAAGSAPARLCHRGAERCPPSLRNPSVSAPTLLPYRHTPSCIPVPTLAPPTVTLTEWGSKRPGRFGGFPSPGSLEGSNAVPLTDTWHAAGVLIIF